MDDCPQTRPALADRLLAGQPAALARAISLVEAEAPAAPALLQAIRPHLGNATVVGFTGPPGAGKSTLVNAFVREMRGRGRTVAVAAVDPSSPLTGGAVLGDRVRMAEHTLDPGVFIRSLASRGHLGGLSVAAARTADLMDAAGFDVVILETVGAGQSEVEMAELADVCIVVSAPGLGDDVQAIKAGILEIAHVLVVNKCDLPLARRTQQQLEAMLGLRTQSDWSVPVMTTNALDGTGLPALADAVERYKADHAPKGGREALSGRTRRLVAQSAAQLLERRILADRSDAVARIISAAQGAEITLEEACERVLAHQAGRPE